MNASLPLLFNRRSFLRTTALSAASAPIISSAVSTPPQSTKPCCRGSFAVDDTRVSFFSEAIEKPAKIVVIGDTHLFRDDARGAPFQQYSKRMAGGYNKTKHFSSGKPTNPEESFEQVLAMAKESGADLFAMVGDIFSFPSQAAIEWVQEKVAAAGVPFLYVAGNHDWHYEGMAGSSAELRAIWSEKRLSPLFQGHNPLMATYEVKGLRVVAIDNSTYEITPEQLSFFQKQVESGVPLILMMHIPLYAPGRPIDFGCGHPEWGAAADRNWEIERRPKWPTAGHTSTTMAFHKAVFSAPNLLGVFAGHHHHQSFDCVNGIPQLVVTANATGAFLTAEFSQLVR